MLRVLRSFAIVIALLVGGLVGLTALAILVLAVFFDWNDARPFANRVASVALGRSVAINGDVDVDFGKVSRLHLENLLIDNADWGRADALLIIGSLDVALELRPLLSGAVVVPSVAIGNVRAALERNADGVGNWVFRPGGADAEAETTAPASPDAATDLPLIRSLVVENADLTFDDQRLDRHFDLTVASLKGGENAARTEITVKGQGTYQGQPLRLDAAMGSYAVLMQHEKPYPLAIRLTAGALRAGISGHMADPRALEGLDVKLDIAGDDLSNLMALTGIPIPPSPPYQLKGELRREGSTVAFKDFAGVLGASDLSGTVATEFGGRRPKIEGDVVSRHLDLKDLGGFIGARGGGESPPPEPFEASGRVLPGTRVDLAQLRALDARIAFKANRIVTKEVPIDRMSAQVSLDDGTLRVQPLTFTVGDGGVRLYVSLYGGQTPVQTDLEAHVDHIDLAQLLEKFGHQQNIAGRLTGHLKLSATGTSVAEILGSSSGDVSIIMSGGRFSKLIGEVIKLDVANALGVLIEGDKSLPVRCIVADFGADRGRYQARALVFDTSNTEIVGSGHVDMRSETIDLRLKPYNKSFSPLALRTPISIQGTFAEPEAFPDPADIGVEGDVKKVLNAVLTLVVGLLPPVDLPSEKDAPCGALISAARQHSGQ